MKHRSHISANRGLRGARRKHLEENADMRLGMLLRRLKGGRNGKETRAG